MPFSTVGERRRAVDARAKQLGTTPGGLSTLMIERRKEVTDGAEKKRRPVDAAKRTCHRVIVSDSEAAGLLRRNQSIVNEHC